MRVLLTGAAGSIGRTLSLGLIERGHSVTGLDREPAPEDFAGRSWYQLDCADPVAVSAVVAEVSPGAIVHFAGHPGESSLPEAMLSHVHTTAALLDAMVAHEVGRIVYASSNHAVGLTPRPDGALLSTETRPRPDSFYGVAKVAAEALLSLYADRHGLDAIALRIGSFLDRPRSTRGLSTWLSAADTVAMVDAALTATAPGYRVIYGISGNRRGWWDLEPGRELGYEPADDAEVFAEEVAPGPDDAAEGAFVGGPFASPANGRPAFDR